MDLGEKFKLLADEIKKSMANPDLDIELCFPNEVSQSCEVKSYPYLRVKYVIEGHDMYEKEIDIDPIYWEKDVKDLVDFVTFQIQQFMEEIDSVEYGGE